MKKILLGLLAGITILASGVALIGGKAPAQKTLNLSDVLTAQGAASDYFLKIEGVDGESTDAKHRNEIDIQSFSWGMSNSGSASTGGGAGAGKVSFSDISVTKTLDKSSPKLMLAVAQGEHIRKATLSATKTTKAGTIDYYTITMEDVLVSSFQQSGATNKGGDVAPTESVSFNFAKIKVEYKPQNPDGTLGASVIFKWDVAASEVY